MRRVVFLKRTVFWLGIVLSYQLAGGLYAQESPKPTAKPVAVAKPVRGSISEALTYTGSIEPNAQVEIFANIPGKIVEMRVDEGDKVKKGDILAKVESEELEFAVQQAEAALIAAHVALMDAESLAKINIESQVVSTEAALAAAQTRLEQVRDISYTQTTTQLEQAEAGLAAIKANLKKIREGARTQEKKQAQALVEQAAAGLENAKSNFERMKNLFEQGAVSKQSFEAVQTQLDVANAQSETAKQGLSLVEEGAREEDIQAVEEQLRQAEARLELAKKLVDTKSWEKDIALAESQVKTAGAAYQSARAAADIKRWEGQIKVAETHVQQAEAAHKLAKKKLADATITSPINGIVSARTMDTGDAAFAAGPVADHFLEIVDVSVVKAVFTVPEVEIDTLNVGDTVNISTAAHAEPVTGKIDFISPIVDKSSRTVTVKAVIEKPANRLRPGMFVEVSIKAKEQDDALLIPRDAVLDARNDSGYVFTAENGTAHKQEVALGLTWGEEVQVVKGLTDSTAVIVDGHRSLAEGDPISIVKK